MSFLTQSHQVFFGHPLCLIPSTSHVIQRLTQSLSSFRSTCPNHLNLLFLIIKPAMQNTITHQHNRHTQIKKSRLRDRTDRAWFSRLLRHPARKRSRSILSTPEPEMTAASDIGHSLAVSPAEGQVLHPILTEDNVLLSVLNPWVNNILQKKQLSLSVLMAIFQGQPGLLKLRMMEVVVTTADYKACKAPVKLSPSTNPVPASERPDTTVALVSKKMSFATRQHQFRLWSFKHIQT